MKHHRIARAALGFALLLGTAGLAAAQQARITGVVTDRQTGQPLVGVQVYIPGTSYASLTQENGRYLILDVPPGTHNVEAQLIGYANGRRENVRVAPGATVAIDFNLGTTVLKLQEVVVTGTVDPTAGVKVPFTVGKVSKEDMPVPAVTAESAIRGRVSGARVVKGSGQPGTGTSVVLRGATSITKSNEPLYVVDGVILAADLVDIDPADIENIEVVKGAAAASLYGSRASAGVIQITTSRGRGLSQGQTRFTVRTEYGTSSLGDHPVKLTQAHHYLMNSAGQYTDEDGNVVAREERVIKPDQIQDANYPAGTPLYNHIDRFFDPGTSTRTHLTIAQNTPSTNFMASFTQSEESGVVRGNEGFKLQGLRLNLDHRVRDDISVSVSSYYSRSDRDDFGGANPFYDLMFFAPDVDLLAPNEDGQPFNIQPDPIQLQANPLYSVHFADYRLKRSRITGNTNIRYSPANWLSVDGILSFDRRDANDYEYLPKGFKTINGVSEGSIERQHEIDQAINGQLQASTLHSFGDLTVRARAQGSFERAQFERAQGSGSQLSVQDVERIDVANVRNGSSLQQDVRSLGMFLITGLDYQGKYVGEAMVRRDGSSLFGDANRWNNYYRGSLAWRMAEESWWPIEQINEFKVRYSIGTAGGRPNFSDQYEVWSVSQGSVSKSVLGNNNLKPELQTEQEIGIDMIAFDRYSLRLTRAMSTVEDQLLQIPLPAVFGYSTQWQNAGTVESNTWEAELEAQVINRQNLSWSLGLVADRTRGKITEFNRACYLTGAGSSFWLCEGEPLGRFRGYSFARSTDQLPEAWAGRANEFQVNDDGLLVWVGEGNSYRDGVTKGLWGTTTENEGVVQNWGFPVFRVDEAGSRGFFNIGDSNPDMNWGLSSNLTWRNLSLYTLFESQVGGDIYSNTRQWAYRDYTHGDYDQRDKSDELKKPIGYYQTLYNVNAVTDWFIEEASYVKLREVAVRYNLTNSTIQRLIGNIGLERASLAVIGRNLMTWTDYKGGFDPEVGSGDATRQRYDGFGYPNFRTITASVEVIF